MSEDGHLARKRVCRVGTSNLGFHAGDGRQIVGVVGSRGPVRDCDAGHAQESCDQEAADTQR